MIFAAGLGTRLKPLTDNKPKALVEVAGKTLLEITIENLKEYGFRDIIVNVHHFSEQIISFLKRYNNFGINIEISDETELLLDTGGGLKKAEKFLSGNQPFLVHNVDVISDINLTDMFEFHIKKRALATLAVKERKTSRYFLFDDDHVLCGWRNTQTGDEKITRYTGCDLQNLAFSGIHVISPKIFSLLQNNGPFSITNAYLNLSSDSDIVAYKHNQNFWLDLGKPEALKKANDFLGTK